MRTYAIFVLFLLLGSIIMASGCADRGETRQKPNSISSPFDLPKPSSQKLDNPLDIPRPAKNEAQFDPSQPYNCIKEGEVYTLFQDADDNDKQTCCPGLMRLDALTVGQPMDTRTKYSCSMAAANSYTCVKKCGDGLCTTGENICNCASDCPMLPEFK